MWESFKDKKDAQGVSFEEVIFPGCKFTDFKTGAIPGSADSYKAFQGLIDSILKELSIDAQKGFSEETWDKLSSKNDEAVAEIVLKARRNFAHVPFPRMQNSEMRTKMLNTVTETV